MLHVLPRLSRWHAVPAVASQLIVHGLRHRPVERHVIPTAEPLFMQSARMAREMTRL